MDYYIGGTLDQELQRTAEMMVDITDRQGVYYAVALLFDSNYNTDRLKALLPFLKSIKGAIKREA